MLQEPYRSSELIAQDGTLLQITGTGVILPPSGGLVRRDETTLQITGTGVTLPPRPTATIEIAAAAVAAVTRTGTGLTMPSRPAPTTGLPTTRVTNIVTLTVNKEDSYQTSNTIWGHKEEP